MHAVDTDAGHDHQSQVTHQQTTVLDGVRHGQDTSANVALQHVNDGVSVGDPVIRILSIIIIVLHLLTPGITVAVTEHGECWHDQLSAGVVAVILSTRY